MKDIRNILLSIGILLLKNIINNIKYRNTLNTPNSVTILNSVLEASLSLKAFNDSFWTKFALLYSWKASS